MSINQFKFLAFILFGALLVRKEYLQHNATTKNNDRRLDESCNLNLMNFSIPLPDQMCTIISVWNDIIYFGAKCVTFAPTPSPSISNVPTDFSVQVEDSTESPSPSG